LLRRRLWRLLWQLWRLLPWYLMSRELWGLL
jgi:hypothetical protein